MAVIATPAGNVAALAAKAATATIPIVFGVGEYPVRLGLVASLARPGGNATGINFFFHELEAKRLELLHELVPKAARVAVLLNPANVTVAETTLRDVQEQPLAPSGCKFMSLTPAQPRDRRGLRHLRARTGRCPVRRARRVLQQPACPICHARRRTMRIPAIYPFARFVEAGGLMSYGPSIADTYRQVGVYAGRILKGDKPADLPVMQPTKFELVINLRPPGARPRRARRRCSPSPTR